MPFPMINNLTNYSSVTNYSTTPPYLTYKGGISNAYQGQTVSQNVNLFSYYKLDPAAVRVSTSRKVWHSATNNLAARTHQFEWKDTGEAAYEILDIANTATGTALNVLQAVGIGAAITGSAAGAVLTGPVFGAVAGVVALAKLGYDAYSNREARHEALRQYVWSLLDDAPPEKNVFAAPVTGQTSNMEDAAAAATYLLSEGTAQYKLMGSKLYDAQVAFNVFWIKFQEYIQPIISSQGNYIGPKTVNYENAATNWTAAQQTAPTGPRGQSINFYDNTLLNIENVKNRYALEQEILRIHQANLDLQASLVPGGPIFEFMRRLVHMGNYLQAPYIIHMATLDMLNQKVTKYDGGRYQGSSFRSSGKFKLDPNAPASIYEKPKMLSDELAKWDMAKNYRDKMRAYSEILVTVSADLAKATVWVNWKKTQIKTSDNNNKNFVSKRRIEMLKLHKTAQNQSGIDLAKHIEA